MENQSLPDSLIEEALHQPPSCENGGCSCSNDCYYCGAIDHDDDAIDLSTINGHDYCDSCINRIFIDCASCRDFYPKNDACTSNDGYQYCRDCYHDTYTYCNDCNDEIHRDDSNEYHGSSYCNDCYTERTEHTSNYFINEHPPIIGTSYKLIRSKRRYGVELESCSASVRKSQTVFDAVSDGSISGPEFVSPILQGDQGFQEIEKLCALSVEADEQCGFHLHIDATDLAPKQVANIANGYKILTGWLYAMVKEERKGNSYCHSINSDFEGVLTENDLLKAIYGSLDKKQGKYHGKRYEFLNTHSFFHRGTLEVRLHHGTFSAKEIKTWINFNLDLVDLFLSHEFNTFGMSDSEILKALFEKFPSNIARMRIRIKTHCKDLLPLLEKLIESSELSLNLQERRVA